MNDNIRIDMSNYRGPLSRKNQFIRLLWSVVWMLFARPLPRSVGSGWKRFLLRCFGAKIHRTARVYSSARVYYPAYLVMEAYSCLDSEVICYNVDMVRIGSNTTISQGTFLCAGSHDVTNSHYPMITAPIIIEDQVWIGVKAFIGMGVTVGQGAVVGATASVYKDVEPWTIVGGNPAKFIKKRIIKG